MLFAKIKEKLLNRRNDIEISEIKDSKGNVIDLEELVNNPGIIVGYYIYNSEKDKLQHVDDIPEEYDGIVYYFGDDYFSIAIYENGNLIGDEVTITLYGVNKINATDGTPTKVYGEDSEGNLVKGAVSGGTQLYQHDLSLSGYPVCSSYIKLTLSTGVISVETPPSFSYAQKSLRVVSLLSEIAGQSALGNSQILYGIGNLGTSNYDFIAQRVSYSGSYCSIRAVLFASDKIEIFTIDLKDSNGDALTWTDTVTEL